jgi:hypothetical protein
MRNRSIAPALFFSGLSVCASCYGFAQNTRESQQKPLTRIFTVGAVERYQVAATISVETHGITTEKIGEKTYAKPYTHEASGQLSWRSTRKMTALKENGSAAIFESLDQFRANCDGTPESSNATASLRKSVRDTCDEWQTLTQMNYEEEEFGLIRGLPVPAKVHDEDDSPLLDYWLRRAFRPSVILPKGPLNFGYQAAHKITNPSGIPSNPEGEEQMEWLEATSDVPAATLHVSQNLRWMDNLRKSGLSNVGGAPAKRQLFYADSLNTISLLDGSILKATRSATRETKEVLDPVPGLPDAPTFGSKLVITVTIQRLP